MKLENQVCSLEQAKRLKELGINQRSHFYHANEYEHRLCTDYLNGFLFVNDYGEVVYLNREAVVFSAFTVAELGVMLPDEIKKIGHLEFHWSDNAFGEGKRLYFPNILKAELMRGHETFAVCMADVLIYLLENKHTTPEEVNERLKNG